MNNKLLRVICFILFVIGPVFILLNTPVLKQFYCDKNEGTCLLKTFNMFQSKPAYNTTFNIKDILNVKNDECKTFVYKEPCIIITTKDKNYSLAYTFKNQEEALSTANNFQEFLTSNNKKVTKYKLSAEKAEADCNTFVAMWGVIILFGLLISVGIVKETKPGESRKRFKAILNKIKEMTKS